MRTKKILAIVITFGIINTAYSQSKQIDKIIGEWWSTKSHRKVPDRILVFGKDSSYKEIVNGSIGSITTISKYYFVNNKMVIRTTNDEMSKVIFLGNNKFKFTEFSDSLTDYKYKLTFKRRK